MSRIADMAHLAFPIQKVIHADGKPSISAMIRALVICVSGSKLDVILIKTMINGHVVLKFRALSDLPIVLRQLEIQTGSVLLA